LQSAEPKAAATEECESGGVTEKTTQLKLTDGEPIMRKSSEPRFTQLTYLPYRRLVEGLLEPFSSELSERSLDELYDRLKFAFGHAIDLNVIPRDAIDDLTDEILAGFNEGKPNAHRSHPR
jgi:hypothetical protein